MKKLRRHSYAVFLFLIFIAPSVHARGVFSGPFPEDNFATIVDPLSAVHSLGVMNVNGLMSGFAQNEPWAGSYWPIHKGLLGHRYADPNFPKSKDFYTNYSYYLSNDSHFHLMSGRMNSLSPSEKYDLLVGDSNWTLTRANWQKGVDDYNANGTVPTWTGICHGWSGATHMGFPSPNSVIDVLDATGRWYVRFYPHDIKALASLLWAQNSPTTKRAGNRCRQERPVLDPIGRPTDPSCLDTNPMTWHMTVVNQVGIQKRSFVMDSSYGPEVWNFPVLGYDYHYFNPSTFETSHQLSSSLVPVADIRLDRFSATRAPQAKYVVGVVMETYHPALVEPTTGVPITNTWAKKRFIYDLELDANMNLVGGEWYGKDHPDFLWAFEQQSEALTKEDRQLGTVQWDITRPFPANLANAAVSASARRQVLANIVDVLWGASVSDMHPNENP